MLSFGQRLKMLRREREFSQADLAENIGVTVQSVSKWECDNTMPDISQIVPLASILNVTTDCLLGVGSDEKSDKNELFDVIDNEFRNLHSTASVYSRDYMRYQVFCYEQCRDFLKKYPMNYQVKLACAGYIYSCLYATKKGAALRLSAEEFDSYYDEGMKHLESIRRRDTDPKRQITAREMLISYFILKEKWDEAEATAMEIPDICGMLDDSLERISACRRDFDKAAKHAEKSSMIKCAEYVSSLWTRARRISIYGDERKEEAIEAWKEQVNAAKEYKRLYLKYFDSEDEPLSDNLPYLQILRGLADMCGDCLALSDIDSALDCVEEATDVAVEFYAWMKERSLLEKYPNCVSLIKNIALCCYNSVIPDDDNILTREERFKACQKRLEELI